MPFPFVFSVVQIYQIMSRSRAKEDPADRLGSESRILSVCVEVLQYCNYAGVSQFEQEAEGSGVVGYAQN